VDIQSTEVNPSPTAFVSILDTARTARLTWLSRMEAAQITNSSDFSGLSSHWRLYKSRSRPAFSPNSGSLGKIQLR
jgi:hypothetical protein